jgi:hypothetical protein
LVWSLCDLLERHADELAELEALDNGKLSSELAYQDCKIRSASSHTFSAETKSPRAAAAMPSFTASAKRVSSSRKRVIASCATSTALRPVFAASSARGGPDRVIPPRESRESMISMR